VEIEAVALVPAPPDDVFEFLCDLENHWSLTGRRVAVLGLNGDRDGGTVRVRGPLGLGRTAETKVTAARSPRLLIGVAELPSGTRARVSWMLAPRVSQTRVRLNATVEHATPIDRLLLTVGGRWWMQRTFERTLERLADRFR
jgi:carbon monoxide dehydrogenase subunit G